MTFVRPTVAVNVLLSGSCSRSSHSQIIYGWQIQSLIGRITRPPTPSPPIQSVHRTCSASRHINLQRRFCLLFFPPFNLFAHPSRMLQTLPFFCSFFFAAYLTQCLTLSPIGCLLIGGVPHTSITAAAGQNPGDLGL